MPRMGPQHPVVSESRKPALRSGSGLREQERLQLSRQDSPVLHRHRPGIYAARVGWNREFGRYREGIGRIEG